MAKDRPATLRGPADCILAQVLAAPQLVALPCKSAAVLTSNNLIPVKPDNIAIDSQYQLD